MNKYTAYLAGGLLLVFLIVYFALNQSQYYRWVPDYETDGENPYDIKIAYELLNHKFDLQPFKERVEKELPKNANVAKGTSYLYIGHDPKYTEDEAWHLRSYVQAGGDAFIITDKIQDSLAEILFYPEDCGGAAGWAGQNPVTYQEKIYATFNHPSINEHYYEFEYIEDQYPRAYQWAFIPSEAFCNSDKRQHPMAALGFFVDKDEKAYNNFVRLKVGEGYFYFHTNPVMFTNLFLVDSAGYEYANFVFAHIKSKKLFWDRESLLSPKASKDKARTRPSIPAKSPLEYIFSQPALRWSWYLCIALGLIYVIFGSKRRQRKIPILELNRNTSLEFVETIGGLYFQQQDHRGIILKQMHLFLAHLRQRYHVVTRELDDKLVARIAVRSKVNKEIINDIFTEYFRLKQILQRPNGNVSAETLNNFYLLIERFHVEVRKMNFNKETTNKN